jgi:hypothetical protein
MERQFIGSDDADSDADAATGGYLGEGDIGGVEFGAAFVEGTQEVLLVEVALGVDVGSVGSGAGDQRGFKPEGGDARIFGLPGGWRCAGSEAGERRKKKTVVLEG